MKRLFTTLGLGLTLAACSPRVITQASQSPHNIVAAPGFVVIDETDKFSGPSEEVGDIEIKDTGLTLSCDYETVIARATKEAQALGANVLKVYEHHLPDHWSTCHRIKAKALRVADLAPFEKEIVWNAARRLAQVDFKASTESRPFEAATSSFIRYHYVGRLFQGKVQFKVETVFDCQNSYFKGKQDPERTLAHEQGHFDITEVFARRFTKAVKEQVADTKELAQKQEAIYRQISTEAQAMHDKYDSEIYADRSKQAGWLVTITQELNGLQAYADKEISLKIKM
ncbi:DUF922 domain-containing protein [Hymenobacter properus]|uniref:DUF922 domain-containing protein n=1 Tax=Hymenobacter properus TaxID=2791026 RepID=A0A931BDC8_9BACT|nr:hypothetical protein [Hymenobacter properus]MBF9141800.1 hypothetical protein [Hymenobacter properus]MBR7720608.1 hypothetical protein [Microvirga sp. SRT04]